MKITNKHWFALTASTLGLTGLSLASGFGDEKYTYDASGNVLEKQIGDQVTRYDYTGNQLNGSTSDSTRKQYAYDSSGRPVSDQDTIGQRIRQIVYGYEDKVLIAETAGKKTNFLYNADGNLVAKSTNGEVTSYTWDGIALAAQDAVVFTNEAHITGGIPVITEGSAIVISDHLGTTLSVGEMPIPSTAFGEGSKEGRFTSKIFIPEIDRYLFPCRLYSASAARWTTQDSTGFPDGANNHTYALNDPITNVDPLGLVSWTHNGPNDIPSLSSSCNNIGGPSQVEQHKAGRDGSCYIETMTQSRKYSITTTIEVAAANHVEYFTAAAHSSSAGYRNDSLTHETVHKDLSVLAVNKMYGAFETWSAGYGSTNSFKTPGAALSAYNADVSAAIAATTTKCNSNQWDNSAQGHSTSTAVAGAQNGTIVHNGTTYPNYPMVVNNPNWGAAAILAINQIQINIPGKTRGDCEK